MRGLPALNANFLAGMFRNEGRHTRDRRLRSDTAIVVRIALSLFLSPTPLASFGALVPARRYALLGV